MAEYTIDKIEYDGNVYKLQDNESGYITVESDPVFSASVASGISATDISNWNGKSNTDEKLKTVINNDVNQLAHYLIFGTNSEDASTKYIDTTGLTYSGKNGTASTEGWAILSLGNSTASGVENNKYGILRLYSNTSYNAILMANNLSNNRTIYLPDASGTVALTSDIPDISGIISDDKTWNSVTLNKSTMTTNQSIYVPYVATTTATEAKLVEIIEGATVAHKIPKYDSNAYLYSTTPSANDNSTKVATTAYVDNAISNGGNVFIATYNVTTIEQVRAAYQAGKYIICNASSEIQGCFSLAEREIIYDVDETTIITEMYIFKYVDGYSGSSTSRVELWSIVLDKDEGWYYNNTNINIPKIILNGSSTTSASFYAPTTAGISGQILTSNGSGAPTWAAAPSITDEKLKTTAITADGDQRYFILDSNNNAASTKTRTTNALSYYLTSNSISILALGDADVQGQIRLYCGNGNSPGYSILQPGDNGSSTVTLTLPNTTGTIALTSDISTPLVGTTANITPTQVKTAMENGRDLYITHQSSGLEGTIVATYFNYSDTLQLIETNAFIQVLGVYYLVTLRGSLTNNTWESNYVEMKPSSAQIIRWGAS